MQNQYTIVYEKLVQWGEGHRVPRIHIKHVETSDLRTEVDKCFNVKFIVAGHIHPICDNCLKEMYTNDFYEVEHTC